MIFDRTVKSEEEEEGVARSPQSPHAGLRPPSRTPIQSRLACQRQRGCGWLGDGSEGVQEQSLTVDAGLTLGSSTSDELLKPQKQQRMCSDVVSLFHKYKSSEYKRTANYRPSSSSELTRSRKAPNKESYILKRDGEGGYRRTF